ncbi:hypothetical protein FOZ62_008082, partial [Perkinsus olseni]
FKRAIIIGLDGLGGYYLRNISDSQAPFMRKMLKSDKVCYEYLARAEYPTYSAPNWASILTGMTTSDTGILTNDWDHTHLNPVDLTDGKVPPVSGRIPPTIFNVSKKYNKNIKTAFIYSWDWLGNLADENVDHEYFGSKLSLIISDRSDYHAAQDLIEQIKSPNPPHLAFIQLSEIDNIGHSTFWGSEEYYKSVKSKDRLVEDIHVALREKKLLRETLIVITSDHGGYGRGHGLWMRASTQVPIIFASPTRKMKEPGNKGDVAPTVLGAMGIPVNKYQRGRDFSSRF